MTATLLFGGLIILLLIGVPIAISLGLSSLGFMYLASDESPAVIAQKLFDTIEVSENGKLSIMTLAAISFVIFF